MEWVAAAALVVTLINSLSHWKERQAWAKERQSLMSAALAPSNPVGAALVKGKTERVEQVKRPMPIDL